MAGHFMIREILYNRYLVDKYIGRGGVAEICKVFHLNRSVHLAMNFMHADLSEDRIFLGIIYT